MKKIVVLVILSSALTPLHAQVSLGYFPFNNTFSITSNPDKLILVDGRLETNTFYGNINPEIFGLINIKRSDLVNIYSGLSCKMLINNGTTDGNYLGGYSISVGTRFKPFEKYHHIHFVFELSPYFSREFTSGTLRAYLGISYKFGKRE